MPRLRPSTRFAALLAHVTLLAALLLPLSALAVFAFWDALAPFAAKNLHYQFDLKALDLPARLAVVAVLLSTAAIEAFGLLGLRRTFLEAAQGRAFSNKAVNGFRRFAWVSLVTVFTTVIQRTLLTVIFSLNDSAQGGILWVQFGSGEAKTFFTAMLLVFTAQIFAEAKRAKDENDAFL